jgi:hypothetical protein
MHFRDDFVERRKSTKGNEWDLILSQFQDGWNYSWEDDGRVLTCGWVRAASRSQAIDEARRRLDAPECRTCEGSGVVPFALPGETGSGENLTETACPECGP